MVSGSSNMSCNNSDSTTGSNTGCSSHAEASTNDSGRSSSGSGSSSKQSSCSSKTSSRESSSAHTQSRTNSLLDNAVFRGSVRATAGRDTQQQLNKHQHQNQHQQGKQQQQQVKHQKMQQTQDQQQRRQQHRKQQQQLIKEDGDMSATSAWPSLSAGRVRAWGERKQVGQRSGGSGGAEGGVAVPAACEASRTHKDAYLMTAARGIQAGGSKDSSCTEAADMVRGSGSALPTAVTPAATVARLSEGADTATRATGGDEADKGAAARVASKRDGAVATGATSAAARAASTNTAHPSVAETAAELPRTATAAAARPDVATNETRTPGKTPLTALAKPTTAAASTVVSFVSGVPGKAAVCVRSSAAGEPKKARAPHRAPWCKSVLPAVKRKQLIDQQQHEYGANDQPQQPEQQPAHSSQDLQQRLQKGQANESITAKELHVESLLSGRGDIVATEKETETDDPAGNASVQTAAPDSRPLSPPTEAFTPKERSSVEESATAGLAPATAAADTHAAQTATEVLQRQHPETRVREVEAPSGDGPPQQTQQKMLGPAAPAPESRSAAASATADTPEWMRAQCVLQQRIPKGDKSEGEVSSVVTQGPARYSSDDGTVAAAAEAPAVARTAGAGESPVTTEEVQTRRTAETTSTLRASPEETGCTATGSKAAGEQHRRLQQLEAENQPHISPRRSPKGTLSCAEGKGAVTCRSTTVKTELAATSADANVVTAPHEASAGGGHSAAAAEGAAAPCLLSDAADTTAVRVPPSAAGGSHVSPRTPANGRRTFAAAAASALRGSATSQKDTDVVPRQQGLQNSHQLQQQQSQRSSGARAPGPPTTSTAERERSGRSHPTKMPVAERAGYLAAACAGSGGPRALGSVAAAPAVAAAGCADGAASGTPGSPASSAAAPALATAASAARAAPAAAAASIAPTPCNKERAEHAVGSATQQERQSHVAATPREEGTYSQCKPTTMLRLEDKEEQLQQKPEQHKQREEDELRDEEQNTEQQRRRPQPLPYGRPPPPTAERPQQLVRMMQPRRCAQRHRQLERSEGEAAETAAHEGEEQEDEKQEQQKRSPSVDKSEGTGTDEGLSIPLTSTILADRRSVFYKTQLCPHAVRGRCRLDEQCNFAHSRRELRPPPRLDKTKICASIKAGVVCPNGERCLFAHNREELRHSVAFYKTNMCRSWISGACMHPHTCNHAHGMRELFFFRTLAAVAGCRDFRRERHGVAAAVAAASTPSKAASVAAALDSLRCRLAAAPSPATTLPASAPLPTAAAGGMNVGDGAARAAGRGGGGGGGGVRSPTAAPFHTAERRGSAFAATRTGGVVPAERESAEGQDAHVFARGRIERQRRGPNKADAETKESGSSSSSESTLTLDSSSSTNGGCNSSRGSLHTGSGSGNGHSFGTNTTSLGPEPLLRKGSSGGSDSGAVQQQNSNPVLQQRGKHASNRAGDRQRHTQGSSATHQQQSTNRHTEQQQPTNSRVQEGNLDDLVALIPLLPDKEREFAELLLAYIEASAADKDNGASLVLPIPPELTVEAVGGGHSRDAATAPAKSRIREDEAEASDDTAEAVATEAREQSSLADGKWRAAATAQKQAATAGARGRAVYFTKKAATAGSAGEKGGPGASDAGPTGGVTLSDDVKVGRETPNKGSRGRAPTTAEGSRGTAGARFGSETAPRAAGYWYNRTAAGEREASPRGQDVWAKRRTHSTRQQLTGRGRQRTAGFGIGVPRSQQQQLTHTQAARMAGAAAAAEASIANRTGVESGTPIQQRLQAHLVPQRQLQQQQKQQQQQARDSLTPGDGKTDMPVKARQTGKRFGRKNGANAVPGNGFVLRREQRMPLVHSWGALEHQKDSSGVQQMHRGQVDRLQNLLVSATQGQTSALAAGATEPQHESLQDEQQPGKRHGESQGQQVVFHLQERVAAACKRRSQQSWTAAAAANAGDDVKEGAPDLSSPVGSPSLGPVAGRSTAGTTGGVPHTREMLSHFVPLQVSQGVHENQRQQLLRTQQQQQQQRQRVPSHANQREEPQNRNPMWTQKEQRCMYQRREQRQQEAKGAAAQVQWLRSTPRDTARSCREAAASGKGTAEEGEAILLTEETFTLEHGLATPGPFDQGLTLETLTVCCSSGVSNVAAPDTSSCSTAPTAAGGMYQETLVQHAWQPGKQRQQPLQPHCRPLPPVHLQSAAAMLLNRDMAAATCRKHPEQQQQLGEEHRQQQQQQQRGTRRQQQQWELVGEKHSEQQGTAHRQQDDDLRGAAAGASTSQVGSWDQAKGVPRLQQQHQQLPRPGGASGFALSEAGRRGGKTRSGASQLQKASQPVNDSRWHHQCTKLPPHTVADAGIDAAVQVQQRPEHNFVRGQPWQPQSGQQQVQQDEQGKADEQQQPAKETVEEQQQQQQHCSTTLPLNLPAYPLLWHLYSGTAGILSPDEMKKQLQQQQRERDIRAAVRACWDDNENDKTTSQPYSSLRASPAVVVPLSSLPSATFPPLAAAGTVLHSAGAQPGRGMYSFPSQSDSPPSAAAVGIPSASTVGSGRSTAAVPVASTSVRVDTLAAVGCAAAVLVAAAGGAGGTPAVGGAAIPEGVQAADAAAALLERGLVESALNATAFGPHLAGEGCSASVTATERTLQQQLVLPHAFEAGEQQASATDTVAAAPLACSLVPLHGEQHAAPEQAGPQDGLELFAPQELQKQHGNSREEDGQTSAAGHLEDEWVYSGTSTEKTSRQSVNSGQRSSSVVAVDSETSVTLLQHLLLQHQASMSSDGSTRRAANTPSPLSSTAEGTLSATFPAAAQAPSGAAPVSVHAAARHVATEFPPAGTAGLYVATAAADDLCRMLEDGDATKTRVSQQLANAEGEQGIQQHLQLQLGCNDAWSATSSTAARREGGCCGGEAERRDAGSSDRNAEFAPPVVGKGAAGAKTGTLVAEAKGATAGGARATGNRVAAIASTPVTSAVRKITAGEQALDEPSVMWRRRAKSFAVARTPAATSVGGTDAATTAGGRRRATTTEVQEGGSAAATEAAKRPLQRAPSMPQGTDVGEGKGKSCESPTADAEQRFTADGVSTKTGAASGEAEAGAHHGTGRPLHERTPAVGTEASVGITGPPGPTMVPSSPMYMCSSFTYASPSFPSSSSPACGLCVDREMVAQRVPLATHDDELPPLGGGVTAVTGASPAWSYSASTAAASDDSVDCRLMLLPNSCMLLDRLPPDERDGVARSKTEMSTRHQERGGTSRLTSGLIRSVDVQGRPQHQLSTQQQQHTCQGREQPQQHPQQQQQPQQQQAKHLFFNDLLTTGSVGTGSAGSCASHAEPMLRENGNASVQQEHQRRDSAAAPCVAGSQSALTRSCITKSNSSSCLYSDSSSTSGKMGARYANIDIRSSSGTARCYGDPVQQLHQKGNYVDYTFPLDSESCRDTNRRTLDCSCSSDNSTSLYSSSHRLAFSSSRSCGSDSGNQRGEEPATEQHFPSHKLHEDADVTLPVGDLIREDARQLLHSNLLSDQAGDGRETGARSATADAGLAENDVQFSPFRTLPSPLFDARHLQQFYWHQQQQQEEEPAQEVNAGLQQRLGARAQGLQPQQQTDLGTQPPLATLAAESLGLEQQKGEFGEERGRCFDGPVADAECNKANARPPPDAEPSLQEDGEEENQQLLPQLQHAHANGRIVLSPATNNAVRPIQRVGRQVGLCEEERRQQEGGVSQTSAAAELPVASAAGERASNLDSNSSTSMQSSLAMMNAVVLIERMMNSLGLES